MSSPPKVEELLSRLKIILNEVKNPEIDIDRALELLEESTSAFKELIEEIEVDNFKSDGVSGS